VGVEAHLVVVVVVVDVAGANAEARVVVGKEEEEVLHETLAEEPPPVYSCEAVERGNSHEIAVMEAALQVVGNVAVQHTTVEQAVEARDENSWMPLNEWEDSRREVEGRATKRTKQRRHSLVECLVNSRKGHFVDQQVEAVGAGEDEEEAEEEAATTLSYQFSNFASAVRRKKSKHIERADNRDPEIKNTRTARNDHHTT
jgi:hypothetical protein